MVKSQSWRWDLSQGERLKAADSCAMFFPQRRDNSDNRNSVFFNQKLSPSLSSRGFSPKVPVAPATGSEAEGMTPEEQDAALQELFEEASRGG